MAVKSGQGIEPPGTLGIVNPRSKYPLNGVVPSFHVKVVPELIKAVLGCGGVNGLFAAIFYFLVAVGIAIAVWSFAVIKPRPAVMLAIVEGSAALAGLE